MSKLTRAIGLMSGTSMDGIDVALIETDGDMSVMRGPSVTRPYDAATRALLVEAIAAARGMTRRDERTGVLADAERVITDHHADAVEAFLGQHGIERGSIDVVGFHGQTVLHRPEAGLTVQLGDGARLAARTRRPVVHDLRANDMVQGGQGAPLAPVYHRALVSKVPERPVAVLNIGGVANVTWIGRNGALLAFDTGPGNALIDDWMGAKTGTSCDRDGRAGIAGRVDEDVVRYLLSAPYFSAPLPKSLDRNAFSWAPVDGSSVEDGAATLAAFTAAAAAKAREHMPEEPQVWVVCGGGRRNRAIMTMLAGGVHHAVVPAEVAGIDGDSLEAEAWAYLAVRSLIGLPITFPGTTGVAKPTTGGVLVKP